MNVGAGGQFNLTGGSTDLATIDLTGGGSFGFTGGTLHAQTILGNVNNQGGTLSPGNSPGSTAIVGQLHAAERRDSLRSKSAAL